MIYFQAFKIREQASALLEQNEELIHDVEDKIKRSEELLEKAEVQQGSTADLLSEVDAANTLAQSAVNRGSLTLKEAQETYEKLNGNFIVVIYVYYNIPLMQRFNGVSKILTH